MDNGFHFSLDRVAEAEKDLDLQISARDAHIEKVIQATEIKGHPVVAYILQLTHDPDELLRLAEGLKMIAPHVKVLDDLKKRKNVFDVIAKEPTWVEWAFGDLTDFSKELDTFSIDQFKS